MFVNDQIKIELNGIRQFVSIRTEKEGLPLLLYLHGGPGDAALPLILKFNKALENNFTVVVWEQRGAGKSYYPFDAKDKISIDLFLDDLYELTKYLLNRFRQKSLYLVGHSWGSVLGLRFTHAHPEFVKTYIGCGQVVNMQKSCKNSYEFALKHADKKTLVRLKKIDCTYRSANWLNELLFVTKQVVKNKGSFYGKSNYNNLITPFLVSKCYTLGDLVRRQKGSFQSIKFLWQELMQTNFESLTHFGTPVVFVEGRHDSHVSSALVKEYFDAIQTQKSFYWFEKSCHFPQWSESEKFNRLLCDIASKNCN